MSIDAPLPDLERVLRRARRLLVRRLLVAVAVAAAVAAVVAVGGNEAREHVPAPIDLSDDERLGYTPPEPEPVHEHHHHHDHHHHEADAPSTSEPRPDDGTTSSSTSSTTPSALPAPSGVDATYNARAGNVVVRWVVPRRSTATEYVVFRNGERLASVRAPGNEYVDTRVERGRTYVYDVEARDGAGNRSTRADAAKVVVPAAPTDTESPSPPTEVTVALTAEGDRGSEVYRVAWQASRDNVGVTEYRVYYDGAWVGSVAASRTEYFHRVPRGSGDKFVVRARDAAGNESGPGIRPVPR